MMDEIQPWEKCTVCKVRVDECECGNIVPHQDMYL